MYTGKNKWVVNIYFLSPKYYKPDKAYGLDPVP